MVTCPQCPLLASCHSLISSHRNVGFSSFPSKITALVMTAGSDSCPLCSRRGLPPACGLPCELRRTPARGRLTALPLSCPDRLPPTCLLLPRSSSGHKPWHCASSLHTSIPDRPQVLSALRSDCNQTCTLLTPSTAALQSGHSGHSAGYHVRSSCPPCPGLCSPLSSQTSLEDRSLEHATLLPKPPSAFPPQAD